MTGEMSKADVTPEAFPIHFLIAKAFRGTVSPFDQYQGPYITVPATATRPAGKLWLQVHGGGPGFRIYNESNDHLSPVMYQSETGLIREYARSALRAKRVVRHKFKVTVTETRVMDFIVEAESAEAARAEIDMNGFDSDTSVRSDYINSEVLAVEAL